MTDFVPTKRTQVKRLAKRGVYDRKTVYQILDEGFICHVGFVSEGHPVVIPTDWSAGPSAPAPPNRSDA